MAVVVAVAVAVAPCSLLPAPWKCRNLFFADTVKNRVFVIPRYRIFTIGCEKSWFWSRVSSFFSGHFVPVLKSQHRTKRKLLIFYRVLPSTLRSNTAAKVGVDLRYNEQRGPLAKAFGKKCRILLKYPHSPIPPIPTLVERLGWVTSLVPTLYLWKLLARFNILPISYKIPELLFQATFRPKRRPKWKHIQQNLDEAWGISDRSGNDPDPSMMPYPWHVLIPTEAWYSTPYP